MIFRIIRTRQLAGRRASGSKDLLSAVYILHLSINNIILYYGVGRGKLYKPILYATAPLNSELEVLTVRVLYILRVITKYTELFYSSEYEILLSQRVFKLPLPTIRFPFVSY